MRVLAVDSSARGRLTVVAAGPGGTLLDGRTVTGADLDTALPALLGELLRPAPDAVVTVIGPGSYTGLRAGMAAALGVAQALGLPLHGTGALQVAAFAAPAGVVEVVALADAGRGGVHLARHRRTARAGCRSSPPGAPASTGSTSRRGRSPSPSTIRRRSPPPTGDPAAALAGAAWQALAAPPLASSGLRAEYVDAGG